MSDKLDYYQILGIERNATEQEIKEAYRFKSVTQHPDHVNETFKNRANEEMKKINIAYGVLGEPQKKKIYDLELDQGKETNQNVHSIGKRIFKLLSFNRRKELLDTLRSTINHDYFNDPFLIEYTSNGFIAKYPKSEKHYQICLADNASPGELYTPGQIAISLKMSQLDVQAALDRLLNTAYIYMAYGKYGVTPKYFADHPEIYYVKDYGVELQRDKDKANQLKRQREQSEKDARQAKQVAEERRHRNKVRKEYLALIILCLLSMLFFIFVGTFSKDPLSGMYAFIMMLLSLISLLILIVKALINKIYK